MKILKIDLKRKTLETIFAIAISTILMLIGIYYLPLIMFLYPILFIILGVRYGLNYAVLGLAISALSLGLMIDMVSGIFIFLAFAPLSISLVYTIKMRKSSVIVLFVSTIVFLISIVLIMNFMENITGISIITSLEEFLNQITNYWIEVLKESGLSNDEILEFKDNLENRSEYILLIMPSIVMMFSLITAYFNYLLSASFLRKLGYGIVSIPKFSRFKLPNNILVGTAIMFLGAFIIRKFELFYYDTIFINITVIISFIFLIQGLSVVDYKLIQKNIKLIPRILIVLVFMIIIPLGWILPLIGILDVIFDFRKFRKVT